MSTLFIDFETHFDEKAGITLKKLPLRKYLALAPIIGVAFAENDEEPLWIEAKDPAFLEWIGAVGEHMSNPENIVVAHNAAFDARVLRFGRLEEGGEPIGLPHPPRLRCSQELSMAAWPNQPTGYSLKNLATYHGLPPKLSLQDAQSGKVSWADYCTRDVVLCREVYRRAIARVAPDEVFVSELANRVRGLHYVVDPDQVAKSLAEFSKLTKDAVQGAVAFFDGLGRDGESFAEDIFGGFREGAVRSVKPLDLKRVLVESLGFDTTTTSLKKINPLKLAASPHAQALLTQTAKAGKGLYYQRRASGLIGTNEIDMELGYFRASNTGRYSAPTTGKGVNKHNLTKRDKVVAGPLRRMFALPDDLCMVRADAASVEYRVEGLLSGCQYVKDLYHTDVDADAYSSFGWSAFGVRSVKGQPMRDVILKAACLANGFCMGLARFVEVLNAAVCDPVNKVTVDDIRKVCAERGWKPPSKGFVKAAQTRVGCEWPIVTAAYEAREAFHRIHHEFFSLANWLQFTVEKCAGSSDPQRAMDYCYGLSGAPDRNLIALSVDRELEFPTVRATVLGHSMPTVTWRHLSVSHPGVDGLGAVTATKGPRRVHRSLLIENVTQSAARNALVWAKRELARRGWTHLDSVHDELRIICARERRTVLQARADLLDVMSNSPWGWAFYAKPSEVTVTRTEYEDEKLAHLAWAKLESGDESWTMHLS